MTDGPDAPHDETSQDRSHERRPGEKGSAFHAQMRAARTGLEHQVEKARADLEHANERINARTGRNLFVAILIALGVGGVAVASLLIWDWIFLIFVAALAILGVFEFSRALKVANYRVDVWPQAAAGAVIIVSAYFFGHFTHWVISAAAVAFVIVWRLIAQMVARDARRYDAVFADAVVSGFIPLYVPFLGSLAIVLLREDGGNLWVLAMAVIVVASDTGAYATGLAFGRHPMAPRISPKKTWEGFAGAALSAMLAGVLLSLFLLNLPFWAGFILGIALLLSATLGDLAESLIKRDLGIKDMSSWLPGHGGVLDRLDSMLPSTAVVLGLFYALHPLAVS